MKFEWGEENEIVANANSFLVQNDIAIDQTISLFISGDTTWDVIRVVGRDEAGEGMRRPGDRVPADALLTGAAGVALFLPTADCYPTVVYDPEHHALGLLHLGWQSTAAQLARKALAKMKEIYGTNPHDAMVYFGPGIKKESYRFAAPDQLQDPAWQPFLAQQADGTWGIDLLGYNQHELLDCGVLATNIHASVVDTALDPHYYSNFGSRRLGKPGPEGRFATVAMLRE